MSAAAQPVEHPVYRGDLRGHKGWVTSIATSESPDVVISASRDKTILVWSLKDKGETETQYGVPVRRLVGHSHYIQDLAISSDGKFAISGSWDGTLRLWNLSTGATVNHFIGHARDVLSVAFSADNRQIASGSRDKTIKLWNTLGQCKSTFTSNGHTEWVSCVRFSPNPKAPTLVSGGWDKMVKVWNAIPGTLRTNLVGHTGFINTITVSPDGSLCASGGKDGTAMLWDINDGHHLSSLEADEVINALTFSPTRYWLCAATASNIIIWDLETKVILDQLKPDFGVKSKKAVPVECVSLCWSADGSVLFAGYTDHVIRCFQVTRTSA